MSRRIKLHEIAHARAGDKGNTSNVSVWVFDPGDYTLVKEQLTAERIKAAYPDLIQGAIKRYTLDHLHGLNFVMQDALEGGGLAFGQWRDVASVGADGVIGGAGPEGEVVDVDMLAGLDRLGGIADDLAELAHRLAGRDRLDRHLVTADDRLARAYAETDWLADGDIAHGDHDLIGRIEPQSCRSIQDFRHH